MVEQRQRNQEFIEDRAEADTLGVEDRTEEKRVEETQEECMPSRDGRWSEGLG